MRTWLHPQAVLWDMPVGNPVFFSCACMSWTITGNPVAMCDTQHAGKEIVTRPILSFLSWWIIGRPPHGVPHQWCLCLSILQMTLSVTIYFPAHCGHTGSPDWGGDVPQGRLWVESRPRRLRPCAVLWPCTFCSDRFGHVMFYAADVESGSIR